LESSSYWFASPPDSREGAASSGSGHGSARQENQSPPDKKRASQLKGTVLSRFDLLLVSNLST
jgi:hypothetical protein